MHKKVPTGSRYWEVAAPQKICLIIFKHFHQDHSFSRRASQFPVLMIKKDLKNNSELQPNIGEVHTDILVYEKGGVIKHIKAPTRVKVELPDL